MTPRFLLFFLLIFVARSEASRQFYVASDGRLDGEGTLDDPLLRIQDAVDRMQPGDVCLLREGSYRETVSIGVSGERGRPIRLEAYQGESVVMDGTEYVSGKWKMYRDGIYRIQIDRPVEQLFLGKKMMIEARWPNMAFNERYERDRWAKVDPDSTHGILKSRALAESGIDWTGAMACLNVAHQWWTWNRPITEHHAGSDRLEYPANLVGLCNYDPAYEGPDNWSKSAWKDDYFYLFGKLEALDVETEWFYDEEAGYLYFFAPEGADPSLLDVRIKARDYAFVARNRESIEIRGIDFFATTLLFENCRYSVLEDCELLYPSYARTITEYDEQRRESVFTKITGSHNLVRDCAIAYANNLGLMVMGSHNSVENSIIHDVNWFGTLIYPALQLSGDPTQGVNWFDTIQYPPTVRTDENGDVTSFGNRASRNTLYNSGNALLVYHSSESIVEYNHVYDGGLACKDVSLIYGCWPFSRGSVVRYNWVHGCYPDHGGIGIRADDQSRNNIFHHNVIWDCGGVGIVAKGEENKIFNNTIFNIGGNGSRMDYIFAPTRAEPFKRWAVQWPQLQAQNQRTQIVNNITYNIKFWRGEDDLHTETDHIYNNYTGVKELPLENPSDLRFSPISGTPLVDAGVVLPGYTDGYHGSAPDLGAYESGLEPWTAGANWQPTFALIE